MARGETYEEFIKKFEPKKTTDDCYTPPEIYEAVKEWAFREYRLDDREIVRPFYPGGDFENFLYPKGCVVLDNPPFSIFAKIVQFYEEKEIDYFLFAPHLTMFSSAGKWNNASCLITGETITYENGAKVNTSFVTNLDSYKIRTVPTLAKVLKKVDRKKREKGDSEPKYEYPSEVITAAMLGGLTCRGADFRLRAEEVHFVRGLDDQKRYKKTIFGAGFLISKEKAKEKERLEKRQIAKEEAKGKRMRWVLSKKEKEIIKRLGKERM